MVGLAVSMGKVPIRCGEACKNEETRRAWGCDRDAKPGGYTVLCWECGGRESECPLCHGTARVAVTRCPSAMVTPEVSAVIRAWRWREHALPAAGGILDQTAVFLEACDLLDAQEGRYHRKDLGR